MRGDISNFAYLMPDAGNVSCVWFLVLSFSLLLKNTSREGGEYRTPIDAAHLHLFRHAGRTAFSEGAG